MRDAQPLPARGLLQELPRGSSMSPNPNQKQKARRTAARQLRDNGARGLRENLGPGFMDHVILQPTFPLARKVGEECSGRDYQTIHLAA